MRAEINVARQRFKECNITLAPFFEFGAAFFLRGLQLRTRALPMFEERAVVVADDGCETLVRYEQVEHFAILLALHDEIADAHEPVGSLERDLFDERRKLVAATVNVADNNRARHILLPARPASQPESEAPKCVFDYITNFDRATNVWTFAARRICGKRLRTRQDNFRLAQA